jgi:restriction system protein
VFPYNCFPSDALRDEYLSTIETRSDREIKDLLRNFLIPYERYGVDTRLLRDLNDASDDSFAKALELDFYRRLFRDRPWQGVSWVLDLIPRHGQKALAVLDAYIAAHIQYFTDQQLDGLLDAMAVLRARYFSLRHGPDALGRLTGADFELVVCELYRSLGFDATLTRTNHDGGVDVIVSKLQTGLAQSIVIQCKRSRRPVGVKVVRELRGVVSKLDVQKGILATDSIFTRAARTFCQDNTRLELIDGSLLTRLLTDTFGSEWPAKIDRLTAGGVRDLMHR